MGGTKRINHYATEKLYIYQKGSEYVEEPSLQVAEVGFEPTLHAL